MVAWQPFAFCRRIARCERVDPRSLGGRSSSSAAGKASRTAYNPGAWVSQTGAINGEGRRNLRTGDERDQPRDTTLSDAPWGWRSAKQVIPLLQHQAEQEGMLILAPEFRATDTWDIIRGAYGPDVEFINRALELVFQKFQVDPAHVAVAGFSYGGSYALSLGLGNGDLFHDIIAFSPVSRRPRNGLVNRESSSVMANEMTYCRLNAAAADLPGSCPLPAITSNTSSSRMAISYRHRYWTRLCAGYWGKR